jgi:hypothetical protein
VRVCTFVCTSDCKCIEVPLEDRNPPHTTQVPNDGCVDDGHGNSDGHGHVDGDGNGDSDGDGGVGGDGDGNGVVMVTVM